MIYPVGDTFFSENSIEEVRPSCPPFLGFGLVVPVRSLNRPAFIGALFLVIDLVSVSVKYIFFALLLAPRAVRIYRAHRQHNVRMNVRLVTFRIMNTNIGAHTLVHEIFLHEPPCKVYIFRKRKLVRQ